MKVAMTTHIAWMQHIDEYPALLNVGEECGYSLGSITNHDLSYIPLNWKREKKTSVHKYRAEMDTKLKSEIYRWIKQKEDLCQHIFHFIKCMM